jgi:hypothetical protein
MKLNLLKLLSLGLIFSSRIVTATDGSQLPFPNNYLDQNTHSAFLISGENTITSDCSFYRQADMCRISFENSQGFKSEISVPYKTLQMIGDDILQTLFDLKYSWDINYPLTGLGWLHLTRSQDHQNLILLIQELELEPLHLRILQPKRTRPNMPAYIYSRKLAEEIYAVFWLHIYNSGQSQCLRNCNPPKDLNLILTN